MKKIITIIVVLFISLQIITVSADVIPIPATVCSSISDISTSVEDLYESSTFTQVLMACFSMIDYCSYNPLYMPSYDYPAYLGLIENQGLYFAIPSTKGEYHLLSYLPANRMLVYMGEGTEQANYKDAEYVIKQACKSYVKLDAEDMLAGANYILNITK